MRRFCLYCLCLALAAVVMVGSLGCSKPAVTPPPKTGAPAASSPAAKTSTPVAPAPKASPAPVAAAKQIELKLSTYTAQAHTVSVALREWTARIEQETKGAVKFNFYYAGTLLTSNNDYDGILAGTADISVGVPQYYPGRFPRALITQLPAHFTNSGVAGSRVVWNMFKDVWAEDLKEVKTLAIFGSTLSTLHFRSKKVARIEDMKGLQIRSASGFDSSLEALGAVPVSMPMNDAYLALQRGVVDGTLGTLGNLKSWKLGEVTKFSLTQTFALNAWWMIMNKKKFESLPQEVQLVFDKNSDWFVDMEGALWDKEDKDAVEWLKPMGNQFVTIEPTEWEKFVRALAPVQEKWVKDMEAKGFKDARQMLAKRDAVITKFGK